MRPEANVEAARERMANLGDPGSKIVFIPGHNKCAFTGNHSRFRETKRSCRTDEPAKLARRRGSVHDIVRMGKIWPLTQYRGRHRAISGGIIAHNVTIDDQCKARASTYGEDKKPIDLLTYAEPRLRLR